MPSRYIPATPRDVPRLLLLAGAGLWLAAIVAAPLLDIQAIYAFFARVCHQLPDRTWFLWGRPLPVCIRCVSIYAGFGLGLATALGPRPGLLRAALAATLAEFLLARTGLDYAAARSLTGALLGFSAAGFAEAGVGELYRVRLSRLPARTRS